MTMEAAERIPHIGIVAGTAEGAALCYRTLCRGAEDFMGRYMHPEITMHTLPLRAYLDAIDRDDWTHVARLLSQSADKLAQAGADFAICPNNTLHKAFDMVNSPIPWLHIAKVVAQEAADRGLGRVGILGTQIVMEGDVYSPILRRLGIEAMTPETGDRVRIQHIITTELIPGIVTVRSRLYLQKIVAKLAAAGADGIVLGCTELPLLLLEEHASVPLLDSARLLALAALRRATPFRNERAPYTPSRSRTGDFHATSKGAPCDL